MTNHNHAICDASRRSFLSVASIAAIGVLLSGCESLPTQNKQADSSVVKPVTTPEQALQRLKEGNRRFVLGTPQYPNLTRERMIETARGGQHPFATIISCSDSRVPVEAIFDQGVGDLFVIRVAGNVADTDEIGTSEYGGGHLGTPLLVVMGHTQCGAVTAVAKGEKVGGSLPKLVDNIIPAVKRAKAQGLAGDALIAASIRENVHQSLHDLEHNSKEIKHLVHEGKLKMVGAIYNIETGEVDWI